MPKWGKTEALEKYHPLRSADSKTSVAEISKWFREASKILPKKLTEEEIEERWQEFIKCQQQT